METKHTKGPWRMDDSSSEYTVTVHAPWSKEVRPVDERTFGDYRGALICEMHYNSGIPTKRKAVANAKLIAAAPDLLDVIIEMTKYLQGTDSNGNVIIRMPLSLSQKIGEAIKKATE